jgi:hypothetical protein
MKFFHASATCRLRRNSIPCLVVDDIPSSSHEEKAGILKLFYSGLLGTVSPCSWRVNLSELYPHLAPCPTALAPLSPTTRSNVPLRL